MTGKVKALGLALLATLATVAAMAPAAQAQFTADEAPVTLTAGQTSQHVFSTAEGEWACESVQFHGEAEVESQPSVTITPTYTDCEAFGLSMEYTGFGHYPETEGAETLEHPCDYVLHADGTVDLQCGDSVSDGKGHLVIDPEASCDVTIPEQESIGSISYENEGEGATKQTLVTFDLEGITYENTGHGFLCTLAGVTHYDEMTHDGTYTGTSEVTGEEVDTPHNHIGIEVHPETHGEPDPITFHSELSETILIGDGTGAEEFELDAGTADCAESGYKGAMSSSTSSSITLTPEFADCDAFGFSNAEIDTNECAYVLHAGGKVGQNFEGSVDIECPEGNAIEVVAKSRGLLKCRATIGPQSGLTSVTYTNEGSGNSRDVKLDLGLTGIKYTQHAGEGTGKCESGVFEDGEISAAPTVIGEDAEKEQVGIWVE
jgi:hypothetical protein